MSYTVRIGSSLSHGKIIVQVRNDSDRPKRCRVLEVYPWQMRVYLSTLTTELLELPSNSCQNESCKDATENCQCKFPKKPFKDLTHGLSYSPCLDRERPTMLEREFILPSHHTIIWTFSFEKKHTHYAEYPVDPNRGLDIQ